MKLAHLLIVLVLVFGIMGCIGTETKETSLEKAIAKCEKMSDAWIHSSPSDRSLCYKNLAVQQLDVSLCNKSYSTGCVDGVKMTIALKQKNVSNCDDIDFKGTKSVCYLGVAILRKESEICDKVDPENKLVGMGTKNCCYCGVALARNDTTICKPGTAAVDACASEIARIAGDFSFCENIGFYKDRCYQGVAYSTKNNSICGYIKSDESMRNDCYRYSAGP